MYIRLNAHFDTLGGSIQGLSAIRPQILAGAISPTQVFDAFSNVLAEQIKLFTVENASLTNAIAATQSP